MNSSNWSLKSTLLIAVSLTTSLTALAFARPAHAQSAVTIAGCSAANFVNGGANNVIQTVGASYSPKCLKVKAGAKVTIQASSHHPFAAMPDINGVDNPFAQFSGATAAVSQVLTQPGLFGYFCTAHGDAEGDGMAGVIWVE